MAKEYQWKAELNFMSGDADWLSHGVTPSTETDWQTAISGETVIKTYDYWYRDSNTAWSGHFQDLLSSRVVIRATQTWNTSVDNRNNLTVTITTTIDFINRDDIQHPSGYYDSNTPGRLISVYDGNGRLVFNITDNQVATARQLSGTINLGTETHVIAPGNMSTIWSSLSAHNQTAGGPSFDDMWMGIQFRNPLPPDYRPGEQLKSGVWKSHNRNGGECSVREAGVWVEKRTVAGGTEGGDPPQIRKNGKWLNQQLIGDES